MSRQSPQQLPGVTVHFYSQVQMHLLNDNFYNLAFIRHRNGFEIKQSCDVIGVQTFSFNLQNLSFI